MRSGRYSTGVTCKAARRAAAWQKSSCCKSRISSYLERYSYELLCMETAKTVTDDDRERVAYFLFVRISPAAPAAIYVLVCF